MRLVNPGDLDEIIADVTMVGPDVAIAAIELAKNSLSEWSTCPINQRISILEKALDILESRCEEAAKKITLENGKPLNEAREEVAAAVRDARFQLAQADRMPVREFPQNLEGKVVGEVWHESVGVFLLITPWNFPLATLLRKLIPALVWGNTVIAKPAEQTPISSMFIFDVFHSVGLPVGVAQLLLGKGAEIGKIMIDHPAVAGISFTGSTEVGKTICRQAAGRNIRLQMEMGGKNALVVLRDADLEASIAATMTAAFTCSGQWCTSTSRVIVDEAIYEKFCRMLVDAVSKLRLGSGFDPDVNFGPVASQKQLDIAKSAILTAKQEGARLLCGGKTPKMINGRKGYFVEPTVFADVTESMQLFNNEVFGPVLGITWATDAGEALRLANSSTYGLCFSVFTSDEAKANWFLKGVDCGMVHQNLHTGHRDPALPIIGWKESGSGIPECGLYARDFYTKAKAVYRYG